MIGKIIRGRYQVIYLLGSGSFGRAYLVSDRNSVDNIWYVLKKLDPFISPITSINWETAKRLFDTEAKALSILGEHERIPRLFDYFEEDDKFYLLQEFIDGYELTEELENKILNEQQIYDLLKDILETLSFIQDKNVIHRDITPDNLIRRRLDNKLVFIDFGAVKQILINHEGQNIRSKTIAIGKETYMPDEQANGRPGFYSDVYAVGVIGIQACIGSLPLQNNDGEFIWRNQTSISNELADILDKMTYCYFKRRYQSALDVLQDLYNLSSNFQNLSKSDSNILKYNYTVIWYERANKLKNTKYCEPAVLLYKKVIELNPKHYKAKFNIGIVLNYLQLYKEAIIYYNQAIEIKPFSSESWFHKGISFYKLSCYKEALEAFNITIKFQPHYAVAWLYRAMVLNQLDDEQEAIKSFSEAIKIRPGFAEHYLYNTIKLKTL